MSQRDPWMSKLFFMPQRWVIGIMGFSCIAVAYMMRVCLNLAITQMVVAKIEDENSRPPECPISESYNITTESIHGRYEWDEYTQGKILSAFYYGYVVTHIPAGIIAERYGAKHTLGFGLLITALLTIMTPYVVKTCNSGGLIITRVVEGLAEGPTSPALAALMSRWVPKEERGRMGSLIFGGAQMGNIIGTLVSGLLLRNGDWPSVFYVFGCVGICWFIIWCMLVYSDPSTHPFITEKEKKFLLEKLGEKKVLVVPWKAMMKSLPLWAIIVAAIGHDWGYFTMVTDLPKYMVDVLKFNVAHTGFLASIPYLVMWISSFGFGALCDKMIETNRCSIKRSRIIYTSIASFGPGIFIVAASYTGCHPYITMTMFTIAMGFMGAYYCGMKVNILDIAPNYAGTGTAFINGIGAISGIITPYLIGYVTPNQTLSEWRVVFWITLFVLVVTNLVYMRYAEGEVQPWNSINDEPSSTTVDENGTITTEIELNETAIDDRQ